MTKASELERNLCRQVITLGSRVGGQKSDEAVQIDFCPPHSYRTSFKSLDPQRRNARPSPAYCRSCSISGAASRWT